MKRVIAMILIGLLVAPPASAGQKQGKPIDWQKAQTLKPGTEVVLTVTGAQPAKVRFLYADETALLTLKPTAPKLPGSAKDTLFRLGPSWPAIFSGSTFKDGRVHVSLAGIFDRDKKLADLSDVVQQTPREDVRAIFRPPSHSHFVRNFLIGFAVLIGVMLIAMYESGDFES
jgi:hypothetical protein